MSLHNIGEISLSISTCFYFIWFLPQLILNFKRKSTRGLSYWMHGLLFIGYSTDLMYGFGRDMQWQYQLVTIIGLISLSFEHIQISIYGLNQRSDKINYVCLTAFIFLLWTFGIYNTLEIHRTKTFYDAAGMLSNVCWFTYMFPQIIKNYVRKSAAGVSFSFVVISLLISLCDVSSALIFKWDWPSLVGIPITLLKKLILLFQMFYYNSEDNDKTLMRRK